MQIQIQKAVESVIEAISNSNKSIQSHFRQIGEDQRLLELSDLVQQGLKHRRSAHKIDSLSMSRKKKRQITSKITQIQQQTYYPITIYGKPRIKLENQTSCVVHKSNHCQSQQIISQSEKNYNCNPKPMISTLTQNKQHSNIRNMKIKRVLQINLLPTTIQPRIKNYQKYQEINQKRIQERVLKRQNLKKEHFNSQKQLKFFKNEKRSNHQQYCSCCSDDTQLLKQVGKIYKRQNKSKFDVY